MLGGGIGNLIDRILSGKVTDFIAVGRFPIFNFADSALTTGCFLLIFWMLLSEFLAHRRREAESQEAESQEEESQNR
jgi:signal peptidase II